LSKAAITGNFDSALLQAFNVPRISQLGIVVENVERAIEFYSEFLGIKPWYRGMIAEKETLYRGNEIKLNLDIVLAYSGKLMIELIQVLDGDKNIYSEHLDKYGEGLHHIGIEVTDFDEKMAVASDLGIKVLQSGFIKSKGGAITKYAYFDTVDLCGYIVELIETRLFGFPVGMSQLMMSLGCLLGDVSKL